MVGAALDRSATSVSDTGNCATGVTSGADDKVDRYDVLVANPVPDPEQDGATNPPPQPYACVAAAP
jgi:hypothetical protein